jgi:PadR family transcriptional regulator, regulatory protein PadR
MSRRAESPASTKTPNGLLHGALDALVLKTLARGPSHGYAVARFIEETTGDAFLIEDGSLYPALYRLERKGWVEAEWGTSELGRRAKLYRLTGAGRAQLAREVATWKRFSAGVTKVFAT